MCVKNLEIICSFSMNMILSIFEYKVSLNGDFAVWEK